ncbi:helix-turn-helix transcriptional regulator [Clostridium sp. Marseille-P2415]|uniref:helix-turn-helix transcriptional regulator n=1 Tax=Clostridium sp. Marseille-P2415 TaxID=1805471 RepID=UPI000988720D|nr:LuxR C-terminal-related transcriptional regulator [Clostridium sp. Marseille-P2415]
MEVDKSDWTTVPKTKRLPKWKMTIDKENELLQIILNLVQDGICILNSDLDILYANSTMEFWYNVKNMEGSKCYATYHGRTEPCGDCPVLRAMNRCEPATDIHLLENINGRGWHRTFCVPVLGSSGEISLVVEYIRDITREKKSNLSMGLMEEQTQLLQDLLEESKGESKRHEQDLINNFNKAIESVVKYLNGMLDTDTATVVQKQLELAIQGEKSEKLPLFAEFNEKELDIARYIRDGYLSKEIAIRLNLSKKTVDYYRMNIRKKLGLGAKSNLKQFLKDNLKTIL